MTFEQLLTRLGAPRPEAVLWDLDGTIIDTEAAWATETEKLVLAHGGVWTPQDEEFINGCNTEDHVARMAAGIAAGGGEHPEPMSLFDELCDQLRRHVYPDPPFLDGSRKVLDLVAEAGIPQALVTATPAPLVEAFLPRVSGVFDAIVTGSEEIPGKPDPAPYLLAASRLGVPADRCLAFEDSVHGNRAARGSGAFTVNVTETPLADLLRRAG